MAEPEYVGNLLDSLGVRYAPDEGELVSDALVVLKAIDPDGCVSLRLAWSDGMSWIERLGMLRAAELLDTAELGEATEED